jgi:hypothetical protein
MWLVKPSPEHAHSRLLPRLSWSWTVLLPSDTYRKPVTSITTILLPFVTYLMTFPRTLAQEVIMNCWEAFGCCPSWNTNQPETEANAASWVQLWFLSMISGASRPLQSVTLTEGKAVKGATGFYVLRCRDVDENQHVTWDMNILWRIDPLLGKDLETN